MKKLIGLILGVCVAGAGTASAGVLAAGTEALAVGSSPSTLLVAPSVDAIAQIPAAMLLLYRQAAAGCPGLSWTVLAAIGTVESDNGRSVAPGVHEGANPAGAEGPMQFEPATFVRYAWPVPPGGSSPPSPYDPVDAVYAAARMLCADGAGRPGRLPGAIWDYNHAGWYVTEVLALASRYGRTWVEPELDLAARAALWALSQIGTPYRWGAERPGDAFDCSGLVQAAYHAVGIALPRVAEAQFAAGPPVPAGMGLAVGDLVFFGTSGGGASHVGIYLGAVGGRAVMVDAPHAGAVVRLDAFSAVVGSSWGDEVYLGATDPAG
jgi:hypothetical protein